MIHSTVLFLVTLSLPYITAARNGGCSGEMDKYCKCYTPRYSSLLKANCAQIGMKLATTVLQDISPAITDLKLLNNSLIDIPPNVFVSTTRLANIDVSYNRLHRITDLTFKHLTNLSSLDLGYNIIDNIGESAFEHMTKLRALQLNNNRLNATSIPPNAFKNLQMLDDLTLSSNPLGNKAHWVLLFRTLSSLETISMEAVDVTFIPKETFKANIRLHSLLLGRNRLQRVPVAALENNPRLAMLHLDNNRIRTLGTDLLKLKSLEALYLQNNLIEEIAPGSLPPTLRYLSLQNNRLKTLDASLNNVLANMQLGNLGYNLLRKLDNNPWTCDCKLAWMQRMVHNRPYQIHFVFPQCASPKNLTGVSFKIISAEQMTCNKCGNFKVEINDGTCACMAGYTLTDDNTCEACRNYTYKSHVGPGSCMDCTPGSITFHRGATECVCSPGYTQNKANECEECPKDTYKTDAGPKACTPCPKRTTSPKGSIVEKQCVCKHGEHNDTIIRMVNGNCIAEPFPTTAPVMVQPAKASNEKQAWTFAAIGILTSVVVLFAVSLMVCKVRRKRHQDNLILQRAEDQNLLPIGFDTQLNKLYAPTNNYSPILEKFSDIYVDPHDVQLGEIIGKGAFGIVIKGTLFNKEARSATPVAVKTVRDGFRYEEREALETEVDQLLTVGLHPNIIKLYGITIYSDYLMLVLEYADNGNLLDFLKAKATEPGREQITCVSEDSDVMSLVYQTACGMEHITHMKSVHRDLAARNILITSSMVAKISDFGLAREVYEGGYYYKMSNGRLPLKWLSPEALFDGKYTNKSDVWGFGIMLWECATDGGSPYPGMTIDKIVESLRQGYTMPRPLRCSTDLYEVIKHCWITVPANRPTFTELKTIMKQFWLKSERAFEVTTHANKQETESSNTNGDINNSPSQRSSDSGMCTGPFRYPSTNENAQKPNDDKASDDSTSQESENIRITPVTKTANGTTC